MLKLDWIEALGDRNPQLLRELKGRLKPRNLIVAGAISLLGQFVLFLFFWGRIPYATIDTASSTSGFVFPKVDPYCTGSIDYDRSRTCLVDGLGNLLVDWQNGR